MKLNKEEFKKYKLISELIWGCVPIDIEWAISTNIYKNMDNNLLI